MSNPQKIGHGAKLAYSVDGGTTYTTVPGVTSDDFGSSKADVIETTAMDSPGVTKTYTGGLFDPGELSVKINVIPGDSIQALLRAWLGDGIKHLFKYTDSSNVETAAFPGILVSMDQSVPDDKIATYSVKIKVAGEIVYGQAVAPTGLSYITTTITHAHGSAITPDDPTVTGIVTEYTVSPALPAGLSIDPLTGVISGTPSATTASADYTVTATNSVGSTTATVTINIT